MNMNMHGEKGIEIEGLADSVALSELKLSVAGRVVIGRKWWEAACKGFCSGPEGR